MKTGHFEIVTMLLATMILVDIFQVKAEVLDMADNAFDDEYLKCTDRMEIKYVPQLLKEEKASHQQLDTVWENAKVKWAARKTQLFLPVNFKDNHGIALMAYISEAQEQTPFYHLFSEAVKMAGQSREDYIYGFQFKAFHFYLTRALQLLRRPCEASSKNVVYRTSQGTSFTFGGLNQARFGHFTLAYSVKPQAADDQLTVLSIYTCLGVDIEKFLDKESERITLIPLNEVFQVSQEGAGNNLILQSTNKTCSHYECAFLGGLKTENCVENLEYFQPIYVYNPGEYALIFKNNLGWAWWLMPVIPALWKAKVSGSLKPRSLRSAWATWWNPISTKNTKLSQAWWCAPVNTKLSQEWWCAPVVPATWETEAEGSLESGRQRLQ
ncbi:ecto-ADP-ribosyltransferase 3 isoform X2 [Trachypithecus francoisi]|uniref:ecto-ADP-ribosyltransferase 3 isoform X2 n=1 Tax=Trachypithecus francoisi TaxID=54180 RepID=UPI00141A8A36|nr:ecto-ADP-ribosyltransferase 3 isoform X2 [Trachypithecus francoisi]